MNFFKKLNPFYTPPALLKQGDVMVLREKILHSVLLFFALFGLVLVVLASQAALVKNDRVLPFVYVFFYLTVLVMTLFRGISYGVRGFLACALLYLLALSELADTGMLGEMRTFLIGFSALTAILFDYRRVIGAVALGQITIAAIGIYVGNTTQPLGQLANYNAGTPWLMASLMFLILSAIISGSITIIISGMQSNLHKLSALSKNLATERDTLEDRIDERTQGVNRRMRELRTAAEITHTISALTDPELLLQQVVELIRERFELYYVGIFLLDAARQNAVLQAGTGEAGRRMLAEGHQLSIRGSSMIGWSVSNRLPRIALDVGIEHVRFNNPHLPLTRSEMALPLIAHDAVLGAMTIQSEKASAFEEDDIAILETIADSIAIALDNDRLYHEIRQRLDEVRTLNRDYLERGWAETMETFGQLSYDYENPLSQESEYPVNSKQVPLMLRDEVVGFINLEIDRADLSSEEQAFIENVSTQTAIALENARLLQETERRAAQEQKLNELTTRFSRAISIDEILRAVTIELGQLPSVAEVSVQLNPVTQQAIRPTPALITPGGNGKERAS
jgi:GAF domain-containing protein